MIDRAPTLLIDTNIWIDYFCPWRTGHRAAHVLFTKAVQKGICLLFAISSSKDVYYQIQSGFKQCARQRNGGSLSEADSAAAREIAWGCVSRMAEIAVPVGCDLSDVWLAQKNKAVHVDYEDNLVIAAAVRSDATQLVTNDRALVMHAPVSALLAEDAVAYLDTM